MRLLYALAAFVSFAIAAPTVAPDVVLCTDIDLSGSCIDLPLAVDDCYDFSGGLSFLNKQLSSATIPDGLVCSFFGASGCFSDGTPDADEVSLQSGSGSDFTQIQGTWGSPSFNDLASSFGCYSV